MARWLALAMGLVLLCLLDGCATLPHPRRCGEPDAPRCSVTCACAPWPARVTGRANLKPLAGEGAGASWPCLLTLVAALVMALSVWLARCRRGRLGRRCRLATPPLATRLRLLRWELDRILAQAQGQKTARRRAGSGRRRRSGKRL